MKYRIEKIESGNFTGLYTIQINGAIGALIGSWKAMLDIVDKIERGVIK